MQERFATGELNGVETAFLLDEPKDVLAELLERHLAVASRVAVADRARQVAGVRHFDENGVALVRQLPGKRQKRTLRRGAAAAPVHTAASATVVFADLDDSIFGEAASRSILVRQ